MDIGSTYTHCTNGRNFIVEDIKVYLNFDGLVETRAIIRFIGGFFDGKINNVVVTADFLSKLTEITS